MTFSFDPSGGTILVDTQVVINDSQIAGPFLSLTLTKTSFVKHPFENVEKAIEDAGLEVTEIQTIVSLLLLGGSESDLFVGD